MNKITSTSFRPLASSDSLSVSRALGDDDFSRSSQFSSALGVFVFLVAFGASLETESEDYVSEFGLLRETEPKDRVSELGRWQRCTGWGRIVRVNTAPFDPQQSASERRHAG